MAKRTKAEQLLRAAIRIIECERSIIVESHRVRSQKTMRTYRDLDPAVRTAVRSMDRWLTAARREAA